MSWTPWTPVALIYSRRHLVMAVVFTVEKTWYKSVGILVLKREQHGGRNAVKKPSDFRCAYIPVLMV